MARPLNFQRFLRSWRDKLGLNREEAARLLGIPERTYEGWENGRPPAHMHVAVLALRYLAEVERHKL